MPQYKWYGTAMSSGDPITTANANTEGNGDPLSWIPAGTADTTTPTASGHYRALYFRDAQGSGVSIEARDGSIARFDLNASGGSFLSACQFIYVPSGTPGSDSAIIAGRNIASSPNFSMYLFHQVANTLAFRNASSVNVSGGVTPALVANDAYQIDLAVITNTTVTPTTSNGRIIGRVRSLSNPTGWNSGSEFYFDTGYTVNVTADKTSFFRIGKTSTAVLHPEFKIKNLQWRYSDTVETSTTKAQALSNFVQPLGPSISTVGTGSHYLIVAVGSPAVNGALSYTITQIAGTTQAPIAITSGIWRVDQDASGPLSYSVEISEAGGGKTTNNVLIPQASSAPSGLYRRRILQSGVWTA